MIRFEWRCSYLDQKEYRVSGHPTVRTIERYSAPDDTIEYFRSIFNYNGDPSSFDREILSRQGGVAVTYAEDRHWPRHWPQDLYNAFVEHLKASHAASLVECTRIWAKCPDVPHKAHPEIEIPRPIYYSPTTRQYETETWYDKQGAEISLVGVNVATPAHAHFHLI